VRGWLHGVERDRDAPHGVMEPSPVYFQKSLYLMKYTAPFLFSYQEILSFAHINDTTETTFLNNFLLHCDVEGEKYLISYDELALIKSVFGGKRYQEKTRQIRILPVSVIACDVQTSLKSRKKTTRLPFNFRRALIPFSFFTYE
jgi:hypothetical protein